MANKVSPEFFGFKICQGIPQVDGLNLAMFTGWAAHNVIVGSIR